ncbi:DUF4255 domain-containing protein [Streptomyces netropsis]|uniref:Pvc16 N-terminal domain-containing protein n=1 Tax=Streptomyces netropsis TaxID=55404 RepID=A0A7W7L8J4_STRNE|nr:DUF4255 domain-containing protein [Streptomyces netropsis]MBB4885537.1 hypothetical protein [Streptomyces netropsis]GGR38866.1 hypothetical protein GCM10010219_50030 [Streptomyces netropsis]
MGSHDVIADVSDILLRVLTEAVREPGSEPTVRLVDLIGRQPGSPGGLGLELFLYEVAEDPSARNRPDRHTLVEDPVTGAVRQERRRAAMALLLRYLLVPTGGTPDAQQRMLGRAVRALYDDAVLQGPSLVPAAESNSVAAAGESLKLRLAPLSLDERAKVWWAIAQPYRLSLNYEVRVVNLDSRDVSDRSAVTEAEVGVGQGPPPVGGRP